MTPEKDINPYHTPDNSSNVRRHNPDTNSGANLDPATESVEGVDNSFIVPRIISPLASPTWPTFEADALARRHSLSLLNRTPPRDSLAAELLGNNIARRHSVSSPRDSLAADLLGNNIPSIAKSVMSSIKDITESLSDFNSCMSSPNNTDGSDKDSRDSFKGLATGLVKKRNRKKSPKQKAGAKKADTKITPEKEPTNI